MAQPHTRWAAYKATVLQNRDMAQLNDLIDIEASITTLEAVRQAVAAHDDPGNPDHLAGPVFAALWDAEALPDVDVPAAVDIPPAMFAVLATIHADLYAEALRLWLLSRLVGDWYVFGLQDWPAAIRACAHAGLLAPPEAWRFLVADTEDADGSKDLLADSAGGADDVPRY